MKLFFIIIMALAINAGCPVVASSAISEMVLLFPKQENPQEIEITAMDNRIKVTNAPVGSRLEIYSVVGIKVKEIEIKQSTSEYQLNIAKGYYIIRIGETVRKVAIR